MVARASRGGVGAHQSARNRTNVWLTPPAILQALGPFDLDPCAAPDPRPWPTAARHVTESEDGLSQAWSGRVWLNPPYGPPAVVGPWMRRMAEHGHGTALIFARTETDLFFDTVWGAASALLFLRGRLHFHLPCGSRAPFNGGAPSVLIAYGEADTEVLRTCGLPGRFVPLDATPAGVPLRRPSDDQLDALRERGWQVERIPFRHGNTDGAA